jgi:hypothetical protein
MSYYKINLKAGQTASQGVAGRVLLIDDIGAAASVDVQLVNEGRDLNIMPARKRAFKIVQDFDAVKFTAAVDCTIAVFLSRDDVSLGFEGSEVNINGTVSVNNDAGTPVPVAVEGGVTLTATNVGINNNNASAVPVQQQQLTNIVNVAAVTVGTSQVEVIHDPTLKRIRFRNSHATAIIALGATGVSLADSPIHLGPGDVWTDDDAAGADWYAISDTPGATLQVQGVK